MVKGWASYIGYRGVIHYFLNDKKRERPEYTNKMKIYTELPVVLLIIDRTACYKSKTQYKQSHLLHIMSAVFK